MKNKHGKKRVILLVIIAVLVVFTGSFLLWTADYYHADASAVNDLQEDSTIIREGNLTILPAQDANKAVIFYPGAKVEAAAYLPLLEKIRSEADVTCILVKMPLNLAIFHINAADAVIKEKTEIQSWYLCGHSLGGAMASQYASSHQDQIDGLILLGSYLYGSYPSAKALTIYGSLNTEVKDRVTYTENVVEIEGGNHAQFGNYGRQKGDPDAETSADEQQKITAEKIAEFINK
jgi:hypothetical protein